MTIREGKWDCPQCGHRGNRGGEQRCQACHRVRGDEVRFYLDSNTITVTIADDSVVARALAGPDWVCSYCESLNPAAAEHCKSCNAERSQQQRATREIADEPAPEPTPTPSLGVPAAPKPRRSWGRLKLWGATGLLLLAASWFMCRSQTEEMRVSRLEWERRVEVERFATVKESSWREELPAGARLLTTERRLHHTDQVKIGNRHVVKTVEEKVQVGTRKVKVGTQDLGNGYFEDRYKEEPVYQTKSHEVAQDEPIYKGVPVYRDWCTYDIDRWTPERTERASGFNDEPRWPVPELGPKQRERRRTQQYLIIFKDDDGADHPWSTDIVTWKSVKPGDKLRVKTVFGAVTELASPGD